MPFKKVVPLVGILVWGSIVAQNSKPRPTDNSTASLNSSFPYYYLPIYSIKYEVPHEKVPDLMPNLISQPPFNTMINSEDVLNLLISQNLVVPEKLIGLDLQKIIGLTGISISDLIRNLTVYVPARKITNIRKIVEGFSIDTDAYEEYIFINDDVALLQLLKTGNYTNETIQHALSVMNQTESQMVAIIKPILTSALVNLPVSSILHNFNDELTHLFSNVNMTIDAISKNQAFHDVLKNFTNTLNNETYWSTATSTNTLVTVTTATFKVLPFKEYVSILVRNIENETVFARGDIYVTGQYSVINVTENLESYIEKPVNNTKNISDCYYISQTVAGDFIVHNMTNITVNSSRIITENVEESIHNYGSPLICKDLLHGILVYQNATNLIFSRPATNYVEKPSDPVVQDEHHPGVAVAGGSTTAVFEFNLILASFYVINSIYFLGQ